MNRFWPSAENQEMSGAEEVFSIYRKRREEGREERMGKGRKKGCSKKSTHNSAASRAMSHFLLAGARSELGYEFLRIRGRHFCFGFSSFHTPSSGLLCIALKSLTPSSTAHAAAGECVETCKRKKKDLKRTHWRANEHFWGECQSLFSSFVCLSVLSKVFFFSHCRRKRRYVWALSRLLMNSLIPSLNHHRSLSLGLHKTTKEEGKILKREILRFWNFFEQRNWIPFG